jgi:hypothetical protein
MTARKPKDGKPSERKDALQSLRRLRRLFRQRRCSPEELNIARRRRECWPEFAGLLKSRRGVDLAAFRPRES